jgi:hypothetical protein
MTGHAVVDSESRALMPRSGLVSVTAQEAGRKARIDLGSNDAEVVITCSDNRLARLATWPT